MANGEWMVITLWLWLAVRHGIWLWVKTFWYWTGTRGYPVQYPVQYPIEQKRPHRSMPPVQYPVQYPCSIPLFNKYPASILGTFCTAPCTAPWPDFATAVWTAPCTAPLPDFATAVWIAPCTAPLPDFATAVWTAPLPDFATAVWTAPWTAPCTAPLPDFATAVWTAPCTASWVLGAWVIPTGVFSVFLCARSDFPRGRELDDWFGSGSATGFLR